MFTAEAMKGFINTISIASQQLPAELSKASLIRMATAERDRVLLEGLSRSGHAPFYRQIVDGVLGAPLEAVKPFGTIVFSYQYLTEIVLQIVQMLAERSPVLTGAYLESIIVFVDDVPAAHGADDTLHLKEITLGTKRVVIVPTVPYARRLEVGKKPSGAPFVVQVKPHIVEETALVANRLFGNFAAIHFNFVDISDPWVLRRAYHRSRRHDITNSMVRYPAIIIEPRVA